MATMEASSSYVVASTPFDHIKTLCEDSVYVFHEPADPEVEIVFIHGLNFVDDPKKAYVTTWLARDGTVDNCWPSTWLVGKFPNARVLSILYDANAWKTATQGRMDSYLVGEKLVKEMVYDEVNIGQHGCPVVYVCHSLGGLIAKQIIVSGHRMSSEDGKIGRLLSNVKALFFYATPHRGSGLANLAKHIPLLHTSPLVSDLEFMNKHTARLNEEFASLNQDVFNGKLKTYVVGETHAICYGLSSMVIVDEASARYGSKYMAVEANHFDVCKPKSKEDTSFLYLVQCIREVVDEDSSSLLVLPDFQVEMEDRMKALKSKLEMNSIVGLVGMGGIGKTTLSKCFYNEERKRYDRCCFLENVKSREDMRFFQEQLFEDLCGSKGNGNKKIEAKLKDIRDCVSRMKVLVVVDDVGTLENLKALQVVAFNDGRTGSKMIVTSRESHNLPEYVTNGIMKLKQIGEVQAMELFSYFAFRGIESDHKAQLHDQATMIVKACGGLPLSLEVIGQYLRRLNQTPKTIQLRLKDWGQTLERLKAAVPSEGTATNDRLWKTLRISYDNLFEAEKRLFLDIACILWQSPSENLIVRIWDSSLELQNLKNCSLIKLGADKKNIVMHDHLRSMGQRIVKEESHGKDWNDMSRLWTLEMLKHLENDGHKGSNRLEGLVRKAHLKHISIARSIWNWFKDPIQRSKSLGSFPKLRLLNLSGNELDVVKFYVRKSSKDLKWLCISHTNVTHESLKMITPLKHLRVLQMVACRQLRTLPRTIGNLSCLRELDLENCTKLQYLPQSIGCLVHLERLGLHACKSLKSLPDFVGDLLHLEELHLGSCESLESLPKTIGNLKLRLVKLNLRGCRSLKSLPDSVGDLLHLEELDLGYCEGLESLPKTIGNLKLRLVKFNLWGCRSLKSLPDSVGDLLHLEELDLGYCEGLESLPKTIGNLKLRLVKLNLRGCRSLKSLPDFVGDLLHMEELDLRGCESLESLPKTIAHLEL